MALKIIKMNPCLAPFADDIDLRMRNYKKTKANLLNGGTCLILPTATAISACIPQTMAGTTANGHRVQMGCF